MNLQYHFVQSKTSKNQDKLMYYGSLVSRGVMTSYEINKSISSRCTVTETDIVAVTSSFLGQIPKCLLQGYTVKIDNLGTFRITLRNKLTSDNSRLNKKNITQLKVSFIPCKQFKEQLKAASFEMIKKINRKQISRKN